MKLDCNFFVVEKNRLRKHKLKKKKQEENTNKFIKICVFFCRYAKGISLWKNLAVLFFPYFEN